MWHFLYSKSRGSSHIKENLPCQDNTYSKIENDVYVISLADGAGSAKHSDEGSKQATIVLADDLCINFDKHYDNNNAQEVSDYLISVIIFGLNEIIKNKKEQGYKLNDLASTILCVAVKDNKYIIFHIGDGVIGFVRNHTLHVASTPENGEFVNTTIFTTSKNSSKTSTLKKGLLNTNRGEITSFILMSDGPEVSLYSKKNNTLSNGLLKIIDTIPYTYYTYMNALLKHTLENLIAKQTTDDCSIIFLVKDKDFPGLDFLDKINYNSENFIELFNLSEPNENRIKQYFDILYFCREIKSLEEISIYFKSKYKDMSLLQKDVKYLLEINLMIKQKEGYLSLVYDNKQKTPLYQLDLDFVNDTNESYEIGIDNSEKTRTNISNLTHKKISNIKDIDKEKIKTKDNRKNNNYYRRKKNRIEKIFYEF